MDKNSLIPDLTRPTVMSIINITPDSFYQGSRRQTDADISLAVEESVNEGAGILDLGGYSSRPGAEDVPEDEEYRRLARGMRIIREISPDIAVSVDTFRAAVVRKIYESFGPFIINDISAGELDREMIPLAAELELPYIAMHMRATPATMQSHTDYRDIVSEVTEYFKLKVSRLRESGIKDIIIDPGFGFAKTTEQNYRLLGSMKALTLLGCPVLAGISRKSMIYKVLDSSPEEALAGTVALNWEALRSGASILRVHDTREATETIRLYEYFIKSQKL